MEFVTVFDELLLPVLARIQRRPEIPDLWSLEGRTEGAECRINVIRLLTHRAVVDTPDALHLISTGKGSADSMSRFVEYNHTEPGKEEF
jgi:hypothetical protein